LPCPLCLSAFLINKPGSRDSKIRKKSITRLKELGKQAFPILKEYKDSSDSKIKYTIRELLEKK